GVTSPTRIAIAERRALIQRNMIDILRFSRGVLASALLYTPRVFGQYQVVDIIPLAAGGAPIATAIRCRLSRQRMFGPAPRPDRLTSPSSARRASPALCCP